MTTNPYAPPMAPLEDVPDGPTAGAPQRPLSVWTFQVVAALAAAFLLLQAAAVYWTPLGPGGNALGALMLVVAIVGNQRRWRIARWAGLALIALAILLLGWMNKALIEHSRPAGTHDLPLSQAMFYAVFACVTLLPAAFWFWHFGFSATSKNWFEPKGAAAEPGPRP